jgi:hypothetical protein
MKNSATDRLGTEHRKKPGRISILNDATESTLSLPTPQKRVVSGRCA